MPRLSLWREKKGNDYKFLDRRISEMYTVGGTGVLVHKYLGVQDQGDTGDATKPAGGGITAIQDLLFVENRDRKYDTSVYTMRGIYQIADQDFDLSQFGIFLAQGTIFMTFHLNDMIELLGRRIIAGDVLELQHLLDLDSLNADSLPAGLKRFYVVTDAARAAEGFTPTWYPHIWRVKLQPLVDSQEYKDVLNSISSVSDPFEANASVNPLADIMSTYNKYLDLNDAVVAQAEVEVPKSGYDTTPFYVAPVNAAKIGDPSGVMTSSNVTAGSTTVNAGAKRDIAPNDYRGYLVDDGLAPNGLHVDTGIAFPHHPSLNDFFLRLDYVPNRLFRFDGKRWIKVEDALRSNITPGSSSTVHNSFVNNTNTWQGADNRTIEERQSLSKAFKPKADN